MSCTSDEVIENVISSAAPLKKSSRSLSHSDPRQREGRDQRAERGLRDEQRPAHVREAPEPRDDQRAAHRARARERHHVAEAVDVAVEDVAREDRQERQQRQPQERRQAAEHAHVDRRHPGELLHVLPELDHPERAVEADAEGPRVRHGMPERLGGLPGERPAARVDDRARDHDRQPEAELVEQRLDREDRRLRVQGVEDRLDEKEIRAPVHQPPGTLGVRRHELIEGDVPEPRVVDVGREGGAPVGGAQHSRDEARRVGARRSHSSAAARASRAAA